MSKCAHALNPLSFFRRDENVQRYLILDFETYSEADLKKVGAWEYSKHPSTEIICAAWTIGERGGKWSDVIVCSDHPILGCRGQILALADAIWGNTRDGNLVVAHNAYFEQCIIHNVMFNRRPDQHLYRPPSDFICTAAMAASHALPRNLEGACLALGLPVQKDMEGRRLMLKHSKPRRPSLKDPSTRWQDEDELKRIFEYCKTDIEAERRLFEALPLLNETERKVWCLDQKINFRGFTVDRPLVEKTLEMIDTESKNLLGAFQGVTGLDSPKQVAKTLEYLKSYGAELPNLQAKTVDDYLKENDTWMHAGVRLALETRQALSKSSNAKYEAFERRSRSDGRIRDSLLYHAASTGRWGGSGVQPQNFPRGNIADTDLACEVLSRGDLGLVHMLYDKPMNVFSSCLRGMIIPSKGCEMFCADYNAIETRVLFWLANHEFGLEMFRRDLDLYVKMAADIYSTYIDQVTKSQRQLGKTTILGAGYGMGPKKFMATCLAQGIEIDEPTAELAIKTYRQVHKAVPEFWNATENAAIRAVQKPNIICSAKKCEWIKEHDFLYAILPSGRKIAYYKPEIKWMPTPWGEKRATLYHYSENPLTKQWELGGTYGGRLVENVVQAVARDLMADAMLSIEKAGYDILFTVHDEIVAERKTKKPEQDLKDFEMVMASKPEWAQGLPIKVEGWRGERYRK